jgi:hypothetical protein
MKGLCARSQTASEIPVPKDKSASREGATGTSVSQPDKMDLLVGAEAIAMFMFGDPDSTRRIYHAWEAHGLPAFKVGQALWARKSALVAWVNAKESEADAPPDRPAM